jgi:hypothetical protein
MKYAILLSVLLAACGGRVEVTGPGHDGVDGTDGKDGKDGIPGVLDATRVYYREGSTPLYSSGAAGAYCDIGDLALSGGCSLAGPGSDAWLTENRPNPQDGGRAQGWACVGWKLQDNHHPNELTTVHAHVQCYGLP